MSSKNNVFELVLGLLISAVLLLSYYKYPNNDYTKLIGLILLTITYFTGILAVILSAFFTLFSLITTLPGISYIWGALLMMLHKLHYMFFSFVVKKILRRNKTYRSLEVKVKKSRLYKSFKKAINKITRRAGLTHQHRLKLFEVLSCPVCKKEIPFDSKVCSYCSIKQKRRKQH